MLLKNEFDNSQISSRGLWVTLKRSRDSHSQPRRIIRIQLQHSIRAPACASRPRRVWFSSSISGCTAPARYQTVMNDLGLVSKGPTESEHQEVWVHRSQSGSQVVGLLYLPKRGLVYAGIRIRDSFYHFHWILNGDLRAKGEDEKL